MSALNSNTFQHKLLDRVLITGIALTLLFIGLEIHAAQHINLPLDITLAVGLMLILICHPFVNNTCLCVRAALALLAFWVIASMNWGIGLVELWLPVFPLVAFFGLGRREGLIWNIAFVVLFIANVGVMEWIEHAPLRLTHALAATASVILTSTFVYLYQSLVEKYQQELTSRHEQLLKETMKRQHISKVHEDIRHELDTILTHIRDVYFHTDADGRFIFIGGAIEDMLGFTQEEMTGHLSTEFYADPDERTRFLNALQQAGDNLANYETIFRHKDEGIVWGSLSARALRDADGKLAGSEGILRNITERKKAESERLKLTQQFQRSQRLESIGILAGGIAHDFNNLLTGIMANAELAQLDIPAESDAAESLNHIVQSSKRAASLIKQMLAYSGRGKFEIHSINLSATIFDIAQLLRTVVSKTAKLELDLSDEPLLIEGDINQIHQVVMNLMTNASDALEGKEGRIHIRTSHIDIDTDAINQMFFQESLKPGRYALLEVRDTGVGMSTNIVHSIFDPFFTTKQSGTGLGLAAALGIIRGHGGGIDIQSEPGKGSTFRLFFPLSKTKNPLPLTQQVPASQPKPALTQANAIVLVVDDEEDVRDATVRMLERSGIRTLTACDGIEAVDTFQKHQDEIAIVLLDLTMPRMGGADALQAIRSIRPQAQVVLCSGYAEPGAPLEDIADGLAGFLHKPFSYRQMMDTLEPLLVIEKADA